MIKRLVWLLLGVGVGVYAVLRAQTSLRRRTDRLRPDRMAGDLVQAMRDLGVDLRKAAEEGSSAAALREAELRDRLDARTTR